MEVHRRQPGKPRQTSQAHPCASASVVRQRNPTLLASVQRDRFAALFLLELTTGIRRGQVCGLRWESVDLDAGEITVHDSRVVVGGQAGDKADGKTENADRVAAEQAASFLLRPDWDDGSQDGQET